jgi:predicted HTH domain antitoxin
MKQERVRLTLPKELLEESDKIAKEKLEDRSTVMRELLFLGLKEYMENKAVKLYVDGRISLDKTAEISNVSIWNFIDILKERKVPIKYDMDDTIVYSVDSGTFYF